MKCKSDLVELQQEASFARKLALKFKRRDWFHFNIRTFEGNQDQAVKVARSTLKTPTKITNHVDD